MTWPRRCPVHGDGDEPGRVPSRLQATFYPREVYPALANCNREGLELAAIRRIINPVSTICLTRSGLLGLQQMEPD